MTRRATSVLMAILVAGHVVPARAQAPPSPARIGDLSEQWVDPVTDAPPGTTHHLFETASRGKGTKGSYLIYLPPGYEKDPAVPCDLWPHGGYGALHLGMKHPAMFGAISSVAPAILQDLKDEPKERTFDTFGDDEAYYHANGPWTLARENADALRRGCTIRLLSGDEDARLRSAITGFHELLTQLRIPHHVSAVKGAGHDYKAIVSGLGDEGFAFWREAFSGAAPASR